MRFLIALHREKKATVGRRAVRPDAFTLDALLILPERTLSAPGWLAPTSSFSLKGPKRRRSLPSLPPVQGKEGEEREWKAPSLAHVERGFEGEREGRGRGLRARGEGRDEIERASSGRRRNPLYPSFPFPSVGFSPHLILRAGTHVSSLPDTFYGSPFPPPARLGWEESGGGRALEEARRALGSARKRFNKSFFVDGGLNSSRHLRDMLGGWKGKKLLAKLRETRTSGERGRECTPLPAFSSADRCPDGKPLPINRLQINYGWRRNGGTAGAGIHTISACGHIGEDAMP